MYAIGAWRDLGSGRGGYLVLARDPVGIRPLYWATAGGRSVYFASEIKAIRIVSREYREFPPGAVAVFAVDGAGNVQGPAWAMSHDLPWEAAHRSGRQDGHHQAAVHGEDGSGAAMWTPERATARLRKLLSLAVLRRLMADVPVGVLLSGGLDSSLVAALAREHHTGTLHSFAAGTQGSPDLEASREVARILQTRHHVRTFTEAEARRALPSIIYHLESFDAPLVRSAVASYFVFETVSEHVKVALSGEGSDELFGGYESLAGLEGARLDAELGRLVGNLHHTNLQRTDRMGLAFGVEARVPFLDMDVVRYAFRLPAHLKRRRVGDRVVDKWVVRAVAERSPLPPGIAHRPKAKFSQGSGAAGLLRHLAQEMLSDGEWRRLQARYPEEVAGSREQALYLRIFLDYFPEESARAIMGTTLSVVPGEVA
ncbi:MAG: asparagine synthetase B [Limnochordaceae bacterium]|nr:asparagine synthetase B [Limnochordaceae bacterium]